MASHNIFATVVLLSTVLTFPGLVSGQKADPAFGKTIVSGALTIRTGSPASIDGGPSAVTPRRRLTRLAPDPSILPEDISPAASRPIGPSSGPSETLPQPTPELQPVLNTKSQTTDTQPNSVGKGPTDRVVSDDVPAPAKSIKNTGPGIRGYSATERQQIRDMSIEARPSRPGHFYGNTVRRRHQRMQKVSYQR